MISFINFLWALCVVVLGGVIYIHHSTSHLAKHERDEFRRKMRQMREAPQEMGKFTGKAAVAWIEVAKHMSKGEVNDWKIAILEADSILDQLLEDLDYVGDNLGERLKNVPKGVMKNYEAAWEAHKTRNRIAHQGASFALSRREAEVAVGNYERVFREFDYI